MAHGSRTAVLDGGQGARGPQVLDCGRPIAQVAKDLDVGSESRRTCVRQALTDGGADGAPTGEQLEELRRLRSETRELGKANETLMAVSVFFAVEVDRTRAGERLRSAAGWLCCGADVLHRDRGSGAR